MFSKHFVTGRASGWRWSFFAFFSLCLVVALSSCSKKEVRQDEPLMTPTEGLDSGATVPADQNVGATDTGATTEVNPVVSEELQTVYFDFDSYRITATGRDAVDANVSWLKSNPNATVQIEGHCDERGTTEYNLALGDRRANAVRDAMTKAGISRNRLSTISYGEERPSDPGHDESAWAKNRRGQFVILSK
jgi:peptidoglycan-associated lipoprotein